MTIHQSGRGTAEEIHLILPVLADLSAEEVGKKQEHHSEDAQKAGAAALDFPHRRISERALARRRSGLVESGAEREIANMMPQTEESTGQKIFLPSRSNEPRFAPQQYYYSASKSGVVPSWAISAAVYRA